MSSVEKLTVETVPSQWIGLGHRLNSSPKLAPYRRIVGVEDDGAAIWAQGKDPGAKSSMRREYDPASTIKTELPLRGDLADRLVSYFRRFLTGIPRGDYNCHTFGFYMEGIETDTSPAYDLAKEFLQSSNVKHDARLALGQHAIIGDSEYPLPYHSIIGLGEESTECIEVTNIQGHLGVNTLANIALRYPEPQQCLYLSGATS